MSGPAIPGDGHRSARPARVRGLRLVRSHLPIHGRCLATSSEPIVLKSRDRSRCTSGGVSLRTLQGSVGLTMEYLPDVRSVWAGGSETRSDDTEDPLGTCRA